MYYICYSCNRGRVIWSLQRGRSLLEVVVNRSLTVFIVKVKNKNIKEFTNTTNFSEYYNMCNNYNYSLFRFSYHNCKPGYCGMHLMKKSFVT